jgi:hypothetical protein
VQELGVTEVKGKDYLPLLGIVVAAVLGFSLLCGAGVVGIDDINNAVSIGTPTSGIVDFVISNMNTMIVETVQAFSLPVITNTNTATLAPTTTLVAFTPSAGFPLVTLSSPGRTSRPPSQPTSTYIPLPTSTNTMNPPPATHTPTLTPTNTLTPTDTPSPTNTQIPTDTPTSTVTQISTDTPTSTVTQISTDTPTPTDTPNPTNTQIPTDTPTDSQTTPTSGP